MDKYSFEKDSLLCLLAVADTIEPIKRFVVDKTPVQDNKVNQILEQIHFDLDTVNTNNDTLVIRFEGGNDMDFEKHMKSIEGLSTWVELDLDKNGNEIRISKRKSGSGLLV